jgi:energy-coupling factor transport system substrate-specific component
MKWINRYYISLILLGIAVNSIGVQVSRRLGLMVYLDSIGTITAGALAGGIAGAIVGVVSNIAASITEPRYWWYSFVSLAYGVLAAHLSRKGVFTSLWSAFISCLLFAVTGALTSSGITWIMAGGFSTGVSSTLGRMLYENLAMPPFLAELLASLLVEILDKTISVLAVFFILKAVPRRFLAEFKYGALYRHEAE